MNKDEKQGILFDDFDDLDWWKKEWQGMPEFIMEDLEPFQSLVVHFESVEDRKSFAKLIEQNITSDTKSLWYPESEKGKYKNYRYIDES